MNFSLILFIQFLALLILPAFIVAPSGFYNILALFDPIFNSSCINSFSFLVVQIVILKFEAHRPRAFRMYLIPASFTIYAFFLLILILGHLEYSVKVLLCGFLLAQLLILVHYSFDRRNRTLTFYCTPSGDVHELKSSNEFNFKFLNEPKLPTSAFDGLVVDFKDLSLPSEWQRFLSDCALKKIKIYNYHQLKENITGKVDVTHLAENDFGDLAPSEIVIFLKRIIDLIFLIIFSPLFIPLILLIAICIILDSKGGAFYVQNRMGFSGKYFKVIKFRSMKVNHRGGNFTEENEVHRITRVGKIIRKYRFDELPQFFNVFKGEMSLIGPRPESAELANWYEKEVPFFMYRHVVRPGISGWGQVMHGYAAGIEGMKDKLAYDFYYIKHFSLWLDFLIWFKTIKTIFTGFGSR
jgi:lipopolysaccharide/colanic/teichoic acid biosynthesis glycosyltransferase